MTYFPYDPEIKPGDINWPENFSVGLRPYITSSHIELGETRFFEFEKVSKDIAIKNNTRTDGRRFNVAIEQSGLSQGRYVTLDNGESLSWEIPITGVYVSGTAGGQSVIEIVATLTQVSSSVFPLLSSSFLKYKGHI